MILNTSLINEWHLHFLIDIPSTACYKRLWLCNLRCNWRNLLHLYNTYLYSLFFIYNTFIFIINIKLPLLYKVIVISEFAWYRNLGESLFYQLNGYSNDYYLGFLNEWITKRSNLWLSVEAGHRAIIFSRLGGIQKDILTEGLHFRVPWFQYPIIYDIRSRPRKLSSPTGSKDLQMVNISLRVLSRPDASTLPSMYRQLGLDYDEKVLRTFIYKNAHLFNIFVF